jgi:outer membrane protein
MGVGTFRAAAAVFVAVWLASGIALAEPVKIAVIDVNRILNDSEAGKAAKEKVEARYQELKKQIDAKQEEAKKLKEEIDKKKILLGKEKLKEKEDALAGKIAELQEMAQKSEKEMQSRQQDVTRAVLKVIEVQVDKAVKDEKIDLLLDKQAGVVHYQPSMDITDKVLELVNKEDTEKKEKAGGK